MRFRNGSKIVALPNSEHLLRGYTAHLIVVDEAAFFHNDETIFMNRYPAYGPPTGDINSVIPAVGISHEEGSYLARLLEGGK